MTPLAQGLKEIGRAFRLSDRQLHEAVTWFAVRGIGFTVTTAYDADDQIAGYNVQRDIRS